MCPSEPPSPGSLVRRRPRCGWPSNYEAAAQPGSRLDRRQPLPLGKDGGGLRQAGEGEGRTARHLCRLVAANILSARQSPPRSRHQKSRLSRPGFGQRPSARCAGGDGAAGAAQVISSRRGGGDDEEEAGDSPNREDLASMPRIPSSVSNSWADRAGETFRAWIARDVSYANNSVTPDGRVTLDPTGPGRAIVRGRSHS
jgi:hypothetical protein